MIRQSSVVQVSQGVALPPFDAISMTLSAGDTVETWNFFRIGLGGTNVARWVITYTDSGRSVISTAVYSDLSTS